jgi:innexin
MGLQLGICREEEKYAKKQALIDYMLKHLKVNLKWQETMQYHNIIYISFLLQRHKMYAIRYWACEALCLVNIIVQLFLMNSFFDGEFFSYGWRVMGFSETPQEQRVDPMVYVFPRVTKCIFHKYGASGSIQKHDSLCILPLNIVNEKTYIFIWFWYIILATMLVGLLIYR